MEERKFFKSVIEIEVLHEDELELPTDAEGFLEEVKYQICEGHCIGIIRGPKTTELSAEEMGKEAAAFGSEPAFFDLE